MVPKQIIVIRKDLKMRRGKEIAQGSHASIAFLSAAFKGEDGGRDLRPAEVDWINNSFKKIVCKVSSEEDLLAVYEAAKEAGLSAWLITDRGLTEFGGVPTNTCCSIGPDYPDNIDPICGDLQLY